MKRALLAGLLIMLCAERLEAGNIWPHSTSHPVATALANLASHAGVRIPPLVVPKISASNNHSFSWSHHSPGDKSSIEDRFDISGSPHPAYHWPSGSLPSPWTSSSWQAGSGPFGWGFPVDKIEQRFEGKFDRLSSELEDLIANVPDYADSDDYQNLVDNIEKLVDRHGDFVDRIDAKIEHITNAIDKTGDTITHLNDLLDRLENNSHIPAKALALIEKQIQRAESRIEDRLAALESKKSALQEKLAEFGMFQADIEDYLQNVQNTTTTPITTSTLAAEAVVNSLAVSLNEAAAQASQALTETTQPPAAQATSTFQAAAQQTASNLETSSPDAETDQTQPDASSTFHSLSALHSPTLESTTPNSTKVEVQFTPGVNLHSTVGGGATEIGGVDVTFESQAGGTFSSDYFQTSSEQSLVQSIGQTAFDKINFLLSDDLQGWELHFAGDFHGSASIVLGYDESLLPAGIDEASLQIMHFNSLKGCWELPEGFTVDTAANQFRFSVDSFSPFVLTFNASSSANPEPSTGVIFSIGLLMLASKRRRKSR